MDDRPDLWAVVRSIPAGCVAGYGEVGAASFPPVSGLLVGRRLRHVPDGVPWWRVVAIDGSLPTAKRDPRIAQDQRYHLASEGVTFAGEKVDMPRHRHTLDTL